MSAFMPVLLWWVQCSHECARDIFNSGVMAAKMIGFILLEDFRCSGDYMMCREEDIMQHIFVSDDILNGYGDEQRECVTILLFVKFLLH
jgi:hypothetical protein